MHHALVKTAVNMQKRSSPLLILTCCIVKEPKPGLRVRTAVRLVLTCYICRSTDLKQLLPQPFTLQKNPHKINFYLFRTKDVFGFLFFWSLGLMKCSSKFAVWAARGFVTRIAFSSFLLLCFILFFFPSSVFLLWSIHVYFYALGENSSHLAA